MKQNNYKIPIVMLKWTVGELFSISLPHVNIEVTSVTILLQFSLLPGLLQHPILDEPILEAEFVIL